MQKSSALLTAKQQRFVAEYLVDGNGTRAAVAAGYGRAGARVAAHRLITKVAIKAALAATQAQDAQRLQIERHEVIMGLLEAIELARAQGSPGAMISGFTAIARMLGFHSPAVHQVVVGRDAEALLGRFEAMSDAELASLAGIEVPAG